MDWRPGLIICLVLSFSTADPGHRPGAVPDGWVFPVRINLVCLSAFLGLGDSLWGVEAMISERGTRGVLGFDVADLWGGRRRLGRGKREGKEDNVIVLDCWIVVAARVAREGRDGGREGVRRREGEC